MYIFSVLPQSSVGYLNWHQAKLIETLTWAMFNHDVVTVFSP